MVLTFYCQAFALQELEIERGIQPVIRKELLDQGFIPYQRKVALLVGIDDYSLDVGPLRYAVRDARAMEQLLRRFLGFDEVKVLEDGKARRADILEALVALSDSLSEGDQFLFFFAGHGVTLGAGVEELGYLLPQNVRRNNDEASIVVDGLSMFEIRQLLLRLPAKHVLMMVDACYSGYAGVTSRRAGRSPDNAGYLATITKRRARQLLTAGRRDERSLESDKWGHSAFTYKVLQGLGDHLADRDRDGIVTALELASYLSKAVYVLTNGVQTPQFADLTTDEGEFVFILPEPSEKRKVFLSQPSSLEVSGTKMVVFDRLGEALWRRTIDSEVTASVITDLDGDGVDEVVVGLSGVGEKGRIFAFDFRGDLLWLVDAPETSAYTGAWSGRLRVESLLTHSRPDGKRQIAVLWSDPGEWPIGAVGLVSHDGRLLATYWNPGPLKDMALLRTGDQSSRILVRGFNNDLAPSYPGSGPLSALLLLDPGMIAGQAPPYWGRASRGRHLWYAVLSPRNTRVRFLDLGEGFPQIEITTSRGDRCSWRLDNELFLYGECMTTHLVHLD